MYHFWVSEQYDEYVVRGGTRFWYNYFNNLGKLEVFDYEKYYPLGTLLLRDYKDIIDQGHVAVICEHFKKDSTKVLYGNIIHAYADKEEGKVGITDLGSSHFYLTNKDGEGYYEYAILPKNWLNNLEWYYSSSYFCGVGAFCFKWLIFCFFF